MEKFKYVGLFFVLFVLGCNSGQQQPASTQAADEAAVRQADENWSKAAQSKKVDDWVAFYSDDAVLLPPNEQKASGKEGARKEIGALLAAARSLGELGTTEGGSGSFGRPCVYPGRL